MRAGGNGDGDGGDRDRIVYEKEAALAPAERWARGRAIRVMSDNPKEPRILCYIDVYSGVDSVRSLVQRVCGTLHEQDILPNLNYKQYGLRLHHDHPVLQHTQMIRGGETLIFCSVKGLKPFSSMNIHGGGGGGGDGDQEEGLLVGYVKKDGEEMFLQVAYSIVVEGDQAVSKWLCEMLSLNPAVHTIYTDVQSQTWLVHLKDTDVSASLNNPVLGFAPSPGGGGQTRLTPVLKQNARPLGMVIDDATPDELLKMWDEEEMDRQYQPLDLHEEDCTITWKKKRRSNATDVKEEKEKYEANQDDMTRIFLPDGNTCIVYHMERGATSKRMLDVMLDVCMMHGYTYGEWGLKYPLESASHDMWVNTVYKGRTYRMVAFRPQDAK